MSEAREPLTSLVGQGGDRRLARSRHPTSRRHPDLARMTARLAERLVAEGHPWPDFAATVIAERGRAGLDRPSFAGTLGVSEEMLAGVEEGVLGAGVGRAAADPGQQ
jgi:butyrate kinase